MSYNVPSFCAIGTIWVICNICGAGAPLLCVICGAGGRTSIVNGRPPVECTAARGRLD